MSKALFFLVLSLALTMGAVHDFTAEANFICTLCQEIIKATKVSDVQTVTDLTSQFSKSIEYFNTDKVDLSKSDLDICQDIKMCDKDELAIDTPSHHERLIDEINSKQSSWTAGSNEKFAGMSVQDIKSLMGTVVDPNWKAAVSEMKKMVLGSEGLPASFDSRTQWANCAQTIGHIRDQSNCGSCWAHGTTEAYNDRACIKSDGKITNLFSVADTTGCCGFLSCFSMGCNGGQVGTPWAWFKSTGVVTGGDYGDKTLCYPYTMPQCDHHVTNPKYPQCSDVTQVSPGCPENCNSGDKRDYSKDKNFASSSYGFSNINGIKQDLVTYGPVTAAFTVYEDFLSYKSGVYKHTTGSELGGHAVKIIGYGTENGQDYWLVNNSWNSGWGDKGLFKIAFGDCGIDSQCHAGLA